MKPKKYPTSTSPSATFRSIKNKLPSRRFRNRSLKTFFQIYRRHQQTTCALCIQKYGKETGWIWDSNFEFSQLKLSSFPKNTLFETDGYLFSTCFQGTSNGTQQKKSSKSFIPPPATIPLRASPPITQAASPIFKSEPITISYRGGSRMRGDQKWPPPECKAQIQAENEARIALARGPQFKPPKAKKDYSSFFAKNALPNSYPGYKAPPGTQHYDEENGYSNY